MKIYLHHSQHSEPLLSKSNPHGMGIEMNFDQAALYHYNSPRSGRNFCRDQRDFQDQHQNTLGILAHSLDHPQNQSLKNTAVFWGLEIGENDYHEPRIIPISKMVRFSGESKDFDRKKISKPTPDEAIEHFNSRFNQ